MQESRLREVATQARPLLAAILEGDELLIATIGAALDAALARPVGSALMELLAALAMDSRLHRWAQARLGPAAESVDRLPPRETGTKMLGAEIRDGEGSFEVIDRGVPSIAADPAKQRSRFLHAQTQERVQAGRTLAVRVSIERTSRATAATALRPFVVPPDGAVVRVTVSAPDFRANGDLQAELLVPVDGDSDPHLFELTAGSVGLYPIRVEAFRGGTFLGVLTLTVSVELDVAPTEGPVRVAEVATDAFEPGEVTLTVERSAGNYRFQLLGSSMYEPVTAAMGDPTAEVSQLAAELKAMAADRSPYRDPEQVRERLKQLGVALWAAAVPPVVQEQYWEQAGRIRMFTIAAAKDSIPFELLYPLNGNNDAGFLAERFPVLRRAYSRPRVLTLPMGSAAYVVPAGSPADALTEVTAIQQRLANRMADRGVLSSLDTVRKLVQDSPGVIHFACHNAFTDTDGSSIALDGGPWKPSDLAVAGQQVALGAASPLVFLNACRTAGASRWFSQMNGWAEAFVRAGAGAFIGSLWAVRSSSACTFATEFYRQFLDLGKPLGEASLLARQAIMAEGGDPTWLAYTVYGSPVARAAQDARIQP
jgi:hypothetical protein